MSLEQIKGLADYGKLASIELSSIDKEERIIYAVQMTDGDYLISTTPKIYFTNQVKPLV